MNITTQTNSLPLATVVNPPTDNLRRENSAREIITQPAPTNQAAAEKGVASERERARTPTQTGDTIDFAAIQEQAEKEASTISEKGAQEQDASQSSEQEVDDSNDNLTEQDAGSTEEPSIQEEFEQQKKINDLQQRDAEVRSHEFAHASVGGAFTGAPSFSFEVGPDGKKYAVEGEVSVDLSPVEGNPRATIAKMQKVHAAALAPANPSVQDTRVASSAAKLIAQAQSELLDQQLAKATEEQSGSSNQVQSSSSASDNIPGNSTFGSDSRASTSSSDEFDQLIEQTLSSQEAIAPTRDQEVSQRAARVETFYLNINQAYERAPRSRFELQA